MSTTTVSTNELAEQLRRRIKREGPITFHDWMKAALYDSTEGYYCRVDRKKWGREGDYRTSPERSSLFGATLARYFAKLVEDSGSPEDFTIMEAGAGDGRLAASILESLQRYFPQIFIGTRYLIEERSPHAQSLAQKNLSAFADRVSFANLDHAQIGFGIILSNELLDAFPVHRVKMVAGELLEFFVDASAEGGFEWLLGAPSTTRLGEYFEKCDIKLGDGQVAEVNLEIEAWLRKVSTCLRRGYVITFDYGAGSAELYPENADDPRYFGTLRSFQRHQIMNDVLASPGEQDLTASINWSFVIEAGERRGLNVVEFERQDKFLLAAGLLEQLEIESKRFEGEAERLRLSNAALEMIFPTRMGAHFQALVQRKQKPDR